MIRVRIQTNWTTPQDIREQFNRCTINGDYKWNDIELVNSDNPNDYDYFIIFNLPYQYFKNYDRKRTIVFCCEPISTRQIFANQYGFDPYKYDDWYYFYDTPNHHNLDKWYISLNYKQLLEPYRFAKSKIMSGVISNTRGLPGHNKRINFAAFLDTLPYYDNFGRGRPFAGMRTYRGMLINKEDGLCPYKYTFNCENTSEPGYFTEKLLDPILCECLCFYDGCTNTEKFINPEAFVKLDLNNPKEALSIVTQTIQNNEWEKRINIVREEKEKLMTMMNPLNIIESIIKHKKPPYNI